MFVVQAKPTLANVSKMFTKATFPQPVADTSFKPTNSKKIMRYPNTRYGNPVEFQYYTQGQPAEEIAKRLKRDKRTVQRWLNGKQRMPWWIPEILRLQRLEYDLWMHQTGLGRLRTKLGVASADVLTFADVRPPTQVPAAIPESAHGNRQAAA